MEGNLPYLAETSGQYSSRFAAHFSIPRVDKTTAYIIHDTLDYSNFTLVTTVPSESHRKSHFDSKIAKEKKVINK